MSQERSNCWTSVHDIAAARLDSRAFPEDGRTACRLEKDDHCRVEDNMLRTTEASDIRSGRASGSCCRILEGEAQRAAADAMRGSDLQDHIPFSLMNAAGLHASKEAAYRELKPAGTRKDLKLCRCYAHGMWVGHRSQLCGLQTRQTDGRGLASPNSPYITFCPNFTACLCACMHSSCCKSTSKLICIQVFGSGLPESCSLCKGVCS